MAHLSSKGIFRIHPLAFAIAFFLPSTFVYAEKNIESLETIKLQSDEEDNSIT